MPAFTFEKIPAPPRIEAGEPAPSLKPRGKLARLVDRLADVRSRSSEKRPSRSKPRKATNV